jgi:endonuclease/exonuclease/phosphatase family metal-dependent hydrolase
VPADRSRPGDGAVTIASLNLHAGLSGTGQPFDVPAALQQLPGDIIAVQEAWWRDSDGTGADDTGADGAEAHRVGADQAGPDGGGADAVGAAARALGARLIRTPVLVGTTLAELNIAPLAERGNWGIAVLTRLPVTSYEAVDLGRAPGDAFSRAALICSVMTPAGWPLRLVNAHLTHRLTSPAQLYRLARHLARSPAPTVIVGDLNMPRLATWVAAGYSPTVRGATFPAHRPVIQLDHLLGSGGLAGRAAAVLPPVGSDHLPVTATFGPAADRGAFAGQ